MRLFWENASFHLWNKLKIALNGSSLRQPIRQNIFKNKSSQQSPGYWIQLWETWGASQFFVTVFSGKCNKSNNQEMGYALLLSVRPWLLVQSLISGENPYQDHRQLLALNLHFHAWWLFCGKKEEIVLRSNGVRQKTKCAALSHTTSSDLPPSITAKTNCKIMCFWDLCTKFDIKLKRSLRFADVYHVSL